MESKTLDVLAQILSNNLGNRLTVELANGIVVSFGQATTPHEQKVVDTPDPCNSN